MNCVPSMEEPSESEWWQQEGGRTNSSSGGGGGGDGDSLKLTTAAVISQSRVRLTTPHLLSSHQILALPNPSALRSMESTFLCHPVLGFFLGHT